MENDKDIVYSQSVKAGKRVYYLDVKRNKRDELFLCITESKRLVNGEGPDATFTFEKHKIFLYQEDFSKFIGALSSAIGYIHEHQSADYAYPTSMPVADPADVSEAEVDIPLDSDLEIKIDFE